MTEQKHEETNPTLWQIVQQGFREMRNDLAAHRAELLASIDKIRQDTVPRELYESHREALKQREDDFNRRLTETALELTDQRADETRYRERSASLAQQTKEALEAKIAAQDAANELALERYKQDVATQLEAKRTERRTGLVYPMVVAVGAACLALGLDAFLHLLS